MPHVLSLVFLVSLLCSSSLWLCFVVRVHRASRPRSPPTPPGTGRVRVDDEAGHLLAHRGLGVRAGEHEVPAALARGLGHAAVGDPVLGARAAVAAVVLSGGVGGARSWDSARSRAARCASARASSRAFNRRCAARAASKRLTASESSTTARFCWPRAGRAFLWPHLLDANLGAPHLRDVFHRMGFSDQEIVALSGAHSLGFCHLPPSSTPT